MSTHITLVYHHGGRLERNFKGVTVYSGGQVSLIPRVNVDMLNLFFMEGLFKDLGYIQWKKFYWGKPDAGGGVALKLLRLDRNVVNMYEDAIKNDDRVVYVYWEHIVDIPTEVEVVDVDAEEVPTPETEPANVNAESVKSPGGRIKKRAQRSQKPVRILRPRKLTTTLGQKASQKSNKWNPTWAGDDNGKIYEVKKHPTKVTVDLGNQKCTCQFWQLTGLPCRHACAAFALRGRRPEDQIHNWLGMAAYNLAYQHNINPVLSKEFWDKDEGYPPLPPHYKTPIGRPTKKRRKEKNEARPNSNPHKLKRRYGTIICKYCGESGHNSRGYEKSMLI
ncbi:hypothetical protein Ahy_A08g038060 [Arachis hypogaea]|uniref:SWIM-type domain-containing protein n=1 Tax=Arachis hypogaea TaxID=3818 RepID=A0A445BSH9_ARAHY|nr:hypothetical protein Ahy_A08g038060 [Arachis hypogaea]